MPSPTFAALLKSSQYRQQPWKNGRGTTAEIAVEPLGVSLDSMLWRLSSAPVAEEGPFSLFPGYSRLLVLVDGTELRLKGEDREFSLRAGKVHGFSGDEKIEASLPGGPVRDLGLIFDPKRVRAKLSWIPFPAKARSFELSARANFFFVAQGEFAASVYPGEYNFGPRKGDALRVDTVPGEPPRIVLLQPTAPDSAMVGAEIDW